MQYYSLDLNWLVTLVANIVISTDQLYLRKPRHMWVRQISLLYNTVISVNTCVPDRSHSTVVVRTTASYKQFVEIVILN